MSNYYRNVNLMRESSETRATSGQRWGNDERAFIALFGGVEAGYLIVKARVGFPDMFTALMVILPTI